MRLPIWNLRNLAGARASGSFVKVVNGSSFYSGPEGAYLLVVGKMNPTKPSPPPSPWGMVPPTSSRPYLRDEGLKEKRRWILFYFKI